ncbi:hypothetical protein BDV26DRAFT_292893 [Aspergillus bertholletiae]|uniref:Uncharacterized protein n=1 Tax=Aspergillus bertholletiae TaxID=1226010 RepID=A0A5N7B7R1_9EURO|nr:hypothetical protein BDV26DRAFT_292893 [Aspergillus bertholletiae]
MSSPEFINNVICTFDGLLAVHVPRDLLRHIGGIRSHLDGTNKGLLCEPLTREARNAVAMLLSSTEMVGFALGIGLWLSLSAHKPQSPVDSAIHCAKAMHSATTGTVTCKESKITFVMLCMAKDFLDSVRCHSTQTTIITEFFRYCLQSMGLTQKPPRELHGYTKLRFRNIGHDEALLREFPALVGTWLFLHDIEVFLQIVSRLEAGILDLDFQRTFKNFENIFLGLAKLTYMRLLQAKEAEKWVTKLCYLHFKSSTANQCLFMSIQEIATHSEFLASLAVLRSSLIQVVSELESGLE